MTTAFSLACTTASARLRPDTRTAITNVLAQTEATAERFGWDFAPVLFGLFDRTAADGSAAIEVDTDFVGPDLLHVPNPRPEGSVRLAVALHRFAANLSSAAARGWLRQWLHTGGRTCVGVGLLFEGWAGWIRHGYQHGDLAKAPATQRGEVRVVAAVDTDLGLHRIVRVRGHDTASVDRWAHLPAWSRDRAIILGLSQLVRATRNQ